MSETAIIELNDNKAGMDELDKDRINSIIIENSKGSKFYENQLKKDNLLNLQIEEKVSQLRELSPTMIAKGEIEADKLIANISASQCFSRTLVHVDMDAFYAAVEMRDDPKLRHKPMAVGSLSMLSTSNYEARRFGVRAAMPGFIALKLCPELVIVPTDFAKYSRVSRDIRAVFAHYDANYSAVSLDEAFLDLTDHMTIRETLDECKRTFSSDSVCRCRKRKLADMEGRNENVNVDEELAVCKQCSLLLRRGTRIFGTTVDDAVREIRFCIFRATKITASAGIAPNTLLAKVASDRNKPNGQYRIEGTPDAVTTFIRALTVRKIPGIGKVSERKLKALGICTCADIFTMRGALYHLSTPCSFGYYMRISLGDGDTSLESDGEKKSRSVERTFSEISDLPGLLEKARELSISLSEDLKEEHIRGKTVTLKLKLSSFDVRTRAQTMTDLSNEPDMIYACVSELVRSEVQSCHPEPLRIRLLGVRMSSLVDEDMCSSNKQWTLDRCLSSIPRTKSSSCTPLMTSSIASTSALSGTLKLNLNSVKFRNDHPLEEISNKSCNPDSTPTNRSVSPVYNKSTESFIMTSSGKTEVESSPAEDVVCPVCCKHITMEEINTHLDVCLNRLEVQAVVRETNNALLISSSKSSSSVDRSFKGKQSKDVGPMDKFLSPRLSDNC